MCDFQKKILRICSLLNKKTNNNNYYLKALGKLLLTEPNRQAQIEIGHADRVHSGKSGQTVQT
jgi:hypothetical protein